MLTTRMWLHIDYRLERKALLLLLFISTGIQQHSPNVYHFFFYLHSFVVLVLAFNLFVSAPLTNLFVFLSRCLHSWLMEFLARTKMNSCCVVMSAFISLFIFSFVLLLHNLMYCDAYFCCSHLQARTLEMPGRRSWLMRFNATALSLVFFLRVSMTWFVL